MDKSNFKKELGLYMKHKLDISTYQTELFLNLLKGKDISTMSLEDIKNIYLLALEETEYKNIKNKNHDSIIQNIYKKICYILNK